MGSRIQSNHGYVSFATRKGHLTKLLCAAATDGETTWTVDDSAARGDMVVFYATSPVKAFVAYGRVLEEADRRYGRRKLLMAQIGGLRFLPKPVSLERARSRCRQAWLKTPQGFGRGAKTGVAQIIELGEGSRPVRRRRPAI